MNLLSIAAAFGIVTAVFQWGWLGDRVRRQPTGPVEAFLPVMLFAILFGLSMDYEVFLVMRIHEEWLRSGDNGLAVRRGLSATGGTITAAAAIMIVVFGSFILGGERIIKEFGLGLAAAILVDAVIIRTALVPSLMLLMGKANWWFPVWLDRILPRIHVEPEDLSELDEMPRSGDPAHRTPSTAVERIDIGEELMPSRLGSHGVRAGPVRPLSVERNSVDDAATHERVKTEARPRSRTRSSRRSTSGRSPGTTSRGHPAPPSGPPSSLVRAARGAKTNPLGHASAPSPQSRVPSNGVYSGRFATFTGIGPTYDHRRSATEKTPKFFFKSSTVRSRATRHTRRRRARRRRRTPDRRTACSPLPGGRRVEPLIGRTAEVHRALAQRRELCPAQVYVPVAGTARAIDFHHVLIE